MISIVSYSSTSSSSDSDDDHEQQRKINDEKERELQSKQTSNSPPIQSMSAKPLSHPIGSYVPLPELSILQTTFTNKSEVEYQRLTWETLKETINECINKANASNLPFTIRQLFECNIIRGRGLLARCIIQAQTTSPFYTSVYAALVAVINSKFPQIGQLILQRLIASFCRRHDDIEKKKSLTTMGFLAHLVNQNVLHEIVALEILTLLFEGPYATIDDVELGIEFLKQCGRKLSEDSPRGLNIVFSALRDLMPKSSLDQRTKSLIEIIFAARKDHFKAYPSISVELDLVYEDDQYTHMITLVDQCEPETMLDQSSENSSSSDDEDNPEKSYVEGEKEDIFGDEKQEKEEILIDQTKIDLVTLRQAIYLTIESSIDPTECARELVQINLDHGLEIELCQMVLDFAVQQQAYGRFPIYLSQRLCGLKKEYRQSFEKIFQDQYKILHRLESFKLKRLAKFFAYLLGGSDISWKVLGCIRLTKQDTTSLSRFFLKNLFFELFEYIGLLRLNRRLNDATMTKYVQGLFPRDTEENTEFAIHFFTSIGLGGLADGLRKYVKRKRRSSPHL